MRQNAFLLGEKLLVAEDDGRPKKLVEVLATRPGVEREQLIEQEGGWAGAVIAFFYSQRPDSEINTSSVVLTKLMWGTDLG